MIYITECPRDAMQGVKKFISTENKIKYINQLIKVGFHTIDFGSFVSPKAIPQLKDTEIVLNNLDLNNSNSNLLSIIANLRGAKKACQGQGEGRDRAVADAQGRCLASRADNRRSSSHRWIENRCHCEYDLVGYICEYDLVVSFVSASSTKCYACMHCVAKLVPDIDEGLRFPAANHSHCTMLAG